MAGLHVLYTMLFHKPILGNVMNTKRAQRFQNYVSRDPLYKMDQVSGFKGIVGRP